MAWHGHLEGPCTKGWISRIQLLLELHLSGRQTASLPPSRPSVPPADLGAFTGSLHFSFKSQLQFTVPANSQRMGRTPPATVLEVEVNFVIRHFEFSVLPTLCCTEVGRAGRAVKRKAGWTCLSHGLGEPGWHCPLGDSPGCSLLLFPVSQPGWTRLQIQPDGASAFSP